MTASPTSDLRRELRNQLLRLVLLVIVVDAVAIGAYFLADMETRSQGVRLGFTALWMGVTLAVVLPSLQKIRVLRGRARRGR